MEVATTGVAGHKAGWREPREPQVRMRPRSRASERDITSRGGSPRFSITATAVPLIRVLIRTWSRINQGPLVLPRLTHFTIRVSLPLSLSLLSFLSFFLFLYTRARVCFNFFSLFLSRLFYLYPSIVLGLCFLACVSPVFSVLSSSTFVHALTHMRDHLA